MGQYDVESSLATCVLHDAAKHGDEHHDAVKRIGILLKTQGHAIISSKCVVEHSIEGCDASSRIDKAMVANLRIHAAANIIKLFVETLVLLTILFLDPELVM